MKIILIVEEQLNQVRECREKLKPFRVRFLVAMSVSVALEMLCSEPIDLVIAGVNGGGEELLELAKRRGCTAPFIFHTEIPDYDEAFYFEALGAAKYVSKLESVALVDAVREVLPNLEQVDGQG